MYLIPSNPRVFNIKWDRDFTRYAPGALAPSPVPPGPPAQAVTSIPYQPEISQAAPVPARRPCRACQCSPRGISKPPQKTLGQLGQTAGVPAGTVLAYSAVWKRDGWGAVIRGWNDPNGVQSDIQGNLAAQWGIVIDGQQHSTSDYINTSGQSGFVLQVHTTSDYGAPGDIQSIIDGAIYAVGKEMPQSTIRVVQAVSPSGVNIGQQTYPPEVAAQISAAQAGLADALARGDQTSAAQYQKLISQLQGGPSDPLTWLSNNWMWVAGAGIGLVAVKELL